jgi:hypothetical protein
VTTFENRRHLHAWVQQMTSDLVYLRDGPSALDSAKAKKKP